MRIGIIGAGMIGGTLTRRLAQLGHSVVVVNRRGAEAIADVLADAGPSARAGSIADAIDGSDLVIVATPLAGWDSLPPADLAGRVVVDATNYYPGRDGAIRELDAEELGSSELLAARLPGARVVKAFNTIYFERLLNAGRPAGDAARLAIPVASDDEPAKALVSGLIDELGFDPVDNGSLADGRNQEPGTPVYNQPVGADDVRRLLGH